VCVLPRGLSMGALPSIRRSASIFETSKNSRSKQILDEVLKFESGLRRVKEMERRAENPVVKLRKIPEHLQQLQPVKRKRNRGSYTSLKGSQTTRSPKKVRF
jgi:hypothetical protein